MRLAIGVAALAALAPMAAQAQLSAIPRSYWGEFSLDPKLCGDDDSNDEARIWISAHRVSMYEAARDVSAVTITARGLRLRFKPWAKEYYAAGFEPEEGLQPPGELVLSKRGEVLNGAYRRCNVKRK